MSIPVVLGTFFGYLGPHNDTPAGRIQVFSFGQFQFNPDRIRFIQEGGILVGFSARKSNDGATPGISDDSGLAGLL